MSLHDRQRNKRLDWLKWLLATCLLLAAIIGNRYYHNIMLPWRVLGCGFLIFSAIMLALNTISGKAALIFARESRVELKKVIWPTQKEILQTTIIVGVLTCIVGVFLWLVDSLLVNLVAYIIDLRF